MNLRRAVSTELVRRGFKRADRMHLLSLGEGFSFWVDTGPLGSKSDIAPFVGLRCDAVEKLSAELLGLGADDYVGTVGANVGYVLGADYQAWDASARPEVVLAGIDAALERFRPFARLEDLPDAWNIKGTRDPGRYYRLVAIWLLLGKAERVRATLAEAEGIFCKRADAVCEQFRGFAARAERRLSEMTGSPT